MSHSPCFSPGSCLPRPSDSGFPSEQRHCALPWRHKKQKSRITALRGFELGKMPIPIPVEIPRFALFSENLLRADLFLPKAGEFEMAEDSLIQRAITAMR